MLKLKDNVTAQDLEKSGLQCSGHKTNAYYYATGVYIEIDVNPKTQCVDITIENDSSYHLVDYDAELLFKVLNSGIFEIVGEDK